MTAGYRLIVVVNGDVVEYDTKKRTHQLITRNHATIDALALDVLAPLVDIADGVVIIRGTEAHTGKSASGEERLAADLDNVIPASESVKSHWQLQRKVEGVTFDVAHHTSMGGMPWTEKQAAVKLAAVTRMRYIEQDQRPPDVVLRSHVHRYSDSGGNYPTFAVTLPAWTLKTAYIHRIGGENTLSDIGGVVFLCEDGKYEYKHLAYKPRKVNIWTAI